MVISSADIVFRLLFVAFGQHLYNNLTFLYIAAGTVGTLLTFIWPYAATSPAAHYIICISMNIINTLIILNKIFLNNFFTNSICIVSCNVDVAYVSSVI